MQNTIFSRFIDLPLSCTLYSHVGLMKPLYCTDTYTSKNCIDHGFNPRLLQSFACDFNLTPHLCMTLAIGEILKTSVDWVSLQLASREI